MQGIRSITAYEGPWMHVLAALRPEELARLKHALGADHSLAAVASARDIHADWPRRADVLVVDPLRLSVENAGAMAWLPSTARGIVAYSRASAVAMRATLVLVGAGVKHVVLSGHDDAPASLRAAVERARAQPISERLLKALESRLDVLQPSLAAVLRRVALEPCAYATVEALCADGRTARRSCDRWVRLIGIRSLAAYLRAMQLAHAIPFLKGHGARVTTAAQACGLGSPRSLARAVSVVFAMTPTRVAQLCDDVVVERLLSHVLQSPETASSRRPESDRRGRP